MKLTVKFVLLLICLHYRSMQGMEEKDFTIINIDSSYYCGNVIVQLREENKQFSSQQDLDFQSLKGQKNKNVSWRTILCSCFLTKKK